MVMITTAWSHDIGVRQGDPPATGRDTNTQQRRATWNRRAGFSPGGKQSNKWSGPALV